MSYDPPGFVEMQAKYPNITHQLMVHQLMQV
jgi:hypothetical protein